MKHYSIAITKKGTFWKAKGNTVLEHFLSKISRMSLEGADD